MDQFAWLPKDVTLLFDWAIGPIYSLVNESISLLSPILENVHLDSISTYISDSVNTISNNAYFIKYSHLLKDSHSFYELKHLFFIFAIHYLLVMVIFGLVRQLGNAKHGLYRVVRFLFRSKINKELEKVRNDVSHSLIKRPAIFHKLPATGLAREQLMNLVSE